MGSRDPRLILPLMAALAGSPAGAAACEPGFVTLRSPEGRETRLSVELARTPSERARGLMFRDDLPASAGMLFVYDEPGHAVFWMKDTPLPLDLLFVDTTGTVTRLAENARPFDLTPIDGGAGVRFVLEINGGLARPLGLGPGAVLQSAEVPQDTAAWPCAE